MVASLFKKSSGYYRNSSQLIKNSAFFFLINLSGVALNFLFAMLAGNKYGSESWGKFTLCLTVLQIVSVVSRIGLDTLIIRFTAEGKSTNIGKVKDFYVKSVILTFFASAVIFLLLFFFNEFVAVKFFNNAGITDELKIAAFAIIPLNLLFLNSEALKGIKFSATSSFFRNVSIWVFATPVMLFSYIFSGEDFLVEIYVAAVILSWLASNIAWFKNISFFNTARVKWISFKAILKEGLPQMLSNSLIYLMMLIDTLMLGILRTEAEVGIYNVAFRISVFLTLSTVAVTAISAPEFAIFNSKNDREGLQNAIGKANRLIFWTTFPPALIIILFSIPILHIFGDEFTEGKIALILLVGAKFFASLSGSRGFILPMIGKQKTEQYISLTVVIIDIILNMIFIPLWGINGAAFSTMITAIIWILISVIYLRKALKINALYIPFLKNILKVKDEKSRL